MEKSVLLGVYLSMLRPVLEYCSPVYHSMLTAEMSEELERMQRLAIRIIYGFDKKYLTILAEKNILTLEDRRKNAFDNYALNLAKSVRFKHWFTENNSNLELRRMSKYTEEFARSKRLYDSPIFAMRRRLNELNVT